METGRLIGGVVLLVIGAVLLYYLYDYMFNIGSVQKKAEIVAGPIAASSTVTDYTGGVNLKQILFTGGELSLSFWMYVTGTQANTTTMKHIVHLGTSADGNNMQNVIAIMLGPSSKNALFIKVGESETLGSTTTTGFNLDTLARNVMGTTPELVTNVCHINNVEYGRWVNVVVVLNNNTCDVYMDGKLARSCVLKSQFQVPDSDSLKFFVLKKDIGGTSASTWNGSLASLNFYNYALSPDEAYRLYFAGPSGSSGDLWTAIKTFFGQGAKAAAVFTAPPTASA